MFLITYRSENDAGRAIWGYAMEKDVEQWITKTQRYPDEIYYIVNVLPVSNEFFDKHDGYLKGT